MKDNETTWSLDALGWNGWFAAHAAEAPAGTRVGRVLAEFQGIYRVAMGDPAIPLAPIHEVLAAPSGRLRRQVDEEGSAWPTVGDWLVLEDAGDSDRYPVLDVLPRQSMLARQNVGARHRAQLLAANVQTMAVVMAGTADFNVRRLERYVALAHDGGVRPLLIISKADMLDEAERRARCAEAQSAVPGIDIVMLSALYDEGVAALEPYLQHGQAVVLLGSSGVGKSTLLNRLTGGDHMDTGGIRESDERGRHTTTHRQLWRLASGALVIDTPGMRELALWDGESGLAATYADIAELQKGCKFTDCSHASEPGCAIAAALADGQLDEGRWTNYLKLAAEAAYQSRRVDREAERVQRARWKQIHKANRARTQERQRN